MECVVNVWLIIIYMSGFTSGTVFAIVGNNATFSAELNPLPDNSTIVSVQNPRNETVFDARGTQSRYTDTGQRMFFSGNTFEGKMTFLLQNIPTEDAGTYTYKNTSIIFGNTTLFVLGIPSKPNIVVIFQPVVNMNMVLKCKVESTTVPKNHNLSMIFNWKVNGVNISTNSRYFINGSTLLIKNMQRNDEGMNITCTASEQRGLTSKTSDVFTVYPLYGPGTVTFLPPNAIYLLRKQETIPDITCSADCKPNCSYKWTKNGLVTSQVSGSILSLRNINCNDTGLYGCTAWNEFGTKTSNVDIKYIDINPVASKLTFETTQDIQLTCSVKGNYRGVVFCSWTQKIGSSVVRTLDGFDTDNETVLKIPYSSYQDAGNYTCYVYERNGMFMNSKDVEVTVNDKPVIAETIKIQEQNRHVEILVDFYSVPKPLKVDWIKEGTVVSLSEKYRQSNIVVQITLTLHEVRVQLKGYRAKLTITNVTDYDFGTYVLRIENVKGIATQQVNYQRKNQQIEEKRETNALDSTIIGIVIGASVTVAVTVTVVIVIYFARRRRINKKENETVKMNEKMESKYEELQVRTAQEPYDAPGTGVLKNIYINDVGDKDHYVHSQTEQDKAEYEEIQGRENSTLEPKSEYEITEIN